MTAVENNAVPKSFRNMFKVPTSPNELCQRCGDKVYQVEKVGPVNEVVFHKQCFRCAVCEQHLTMKTYFMNRMESHDKEIYCHNHVPKDAMHGLDASSVGIKLALGAPKAYNKGVTEHSGWSMGQAPNIGSDAMYINQATSAQYEFQRKYKQQHQQHHYPAYIHKAKERVYRAQEELERQQKGEEDRLLREFQRERDLFEQNMQQETEQDWEIRLKELTEKFDVDMNKKGKKLKGDEQKAMTMKYEEEKENMKKNATIKLKEKKEAMTLRIQKKEQAQTSSLVTKHSQQMLEMLQIEQEKIKQDLAKDYDPDTADGTLEEAMAALSLPKELPPPHPPNIRKRDMYYDPSVFKELDEDVFSIAEKDHTTFTDLVKDLTEHCFTDLQKARAIFRWITVKDLNVLEFDEVIDIDSPIGLLRGIKHGTETYHTLFMRLCSYAGLACVEIKGHSKSVGYEPGMKIREDTFQNTWNAVLIEDHWWPVQCNWGARHLVLNKDIQEKPQKSKKQDKIRYQYDEHYFLTDPDEFIQEFWADEPDWQLLEKAVTLEEFESMPFVRSVFFHYGLDYEKVMKAVLYTDTKGGTEVKIRVPAEFEKDLVFHYQIRFADRERRHDTEFRGAKLERFVFHSLVDSYALFSVHVPTPAAYFLEIFANKIDDSNKIGDDPNATMMPFRLKCACKFKIICEELVGKMHPLPNCASGEWGPSKGKRHFDLKALTHSTGVVNVDNDAEVRFKLPRALHFLCKLRMNGVEDHLLEKYISHTVHDMTLVVRVRPPQPGQYGLDIYARPEDAADNHTLAHACKYLLNCTRVTEPVDLPVSKVEASQKMSKEKWGPAAAFDELGIKLTSHKEATIEKSDTGALTIEVGLSEPLKLSFHLIREPDEDCRERVTMKENGKKAKFVLTLPKAGNYLFAIYARKKKESNSDMLNVYNYMVRYRPSQEETDTMKKKKSKGLFKK